MGADRGTTIEDLSLGARDVMMGERPPWAGGVTAGRRLGDGWATAG
jgi:hypothetical protein